MDIIPAKKVPIVLDATVLTSLMSCGRKTDLRYNSRLQPMGGKSNSLECGSIVHTVLEHYYKRTIEGMKRDSAVGHALAAGELYIRGCAHCTDFEPVHHSVDPNENDTGNHVCNELCVLTPICKHQPGEFPGVHNTPPESTTQPNRTGWQDVLRTCEEYFEYYKNDHWVPLFVEEVKSEVLYQDDDIRILWKAKLDLGVDTNQGIYPVDHKTMKQRRDTVSLNNQFIGQCLIMKSRGVVINKIGFQKSLKPQEKFIRPMVSYSADRLLEWQSEILPFWAYQLLSYTESGYWPPNFRECEGKYGNCEYKDVCEADRNMREDTLRQSFIVGPEWNPTNLEGEE